MVDFRETENHFNMKFNHSLQFNAVPEWTTRYIDYSALKKLIYVLEKESVEEERQGDEEMAALIAQDAEERFVAALEVELTKIDQFYAETEIKLFDDLDTLIADESAYEQKIQLAHLEGIDSSNQYLYQGSMHRRPSDDEPSEDEADLQATTSDEEHPEMYYPHTSSSGDGDRPPRVRQGRRLSKFLEDLGHSEPRNDGYLSDLRITLKRRAIGAYVSLCELRSYCDLNRTGFSKALKKFDKILNKTLREKYMSGPLAKSYIFSDQTQETLEGHIQLAVSLYSRLATNGNEREALQQLQLHLREHIVWERNTVWRDMIGMERQSFGTKAVGPQEAENDVKWFRVGQIWIPSSLISPNAILLAFIALLVLSLLNFPVLDSTVQNHCLAVVIGASLLWATEAMPLFVTSLMVPFLIVVLQIPLDSDGNRMSAEDASKFIFSQMCSSVIILLLGGFTLAAVLSKYHIAKTLASVVLSRAGTNPKIILLVLMIVAAFLSMWISNVAAPVLCYSLAQPLLRTLPEGSDFARAVILGVAFASNIGGMVSPIASPQNIIALENMSPEPSWGTWFFIAIPVSVIGLILVWLLLILTLPFDKETTSLGHVRAVEDKFTGAQYFICIVSLATIILWCFSHQLEPYFGEMGILALIPIVVFFGTGLLSQADFNNFLWTIIALAMGGIALGKAVASSGLLATVAAGIERQVHGLSLFGIACVFGFMILMVATFVSHTVAALIFLPLVKSVGDSLENPHPRLLVMMSALLCSAAMGLPTSGFPNVTAICMVDELGKPYLTVRSFISRGVPSSILVYMVVATVGYTLMMLVGF